LSLRGNCLSLRGSCLSLRGSCLSRALLATLFYRCNARLPFLVEYENEVACHYYSTGYVLCTEGIFRTNTFKFAFLYVHNSMFIESVKASNSTWQCTYVFLGQWRLVTFSCTMPTTKLVREVVLTDTVLTYLTMTVCLKAVYQLYRLYIVRQWGKRQRKGYGRSSSSDLFEDDYCSRIFLAGLGKSWWG
jgi:hypothetical protein